MSCCGSTRRAATAPAPPIPHHEVPLRLRGPRPVDAHGPVTGRVYRFRPEQPLVAVHPRDAPYLVGTGWFTRHPAG